MMLRHSGRKMIRGFIDFAYIVRTPPGIRTSAVLREVKCFSVPPYPLHPFVHQAPVTISTKTAIFLQSGISVALKSYFLTEGACMPTGMASNG